MYYCEDHRSRNKFKEDHLVLPMATPLPHHHFHNALGVGKSEYHPEGVVGVVVWQGRGHWKDKMIFFELGLGTITHQMISSCK